MQCFISTNQAQDKALCMFVRSLTCFMSSFFWFHLWISVMLSELDEIAAGFSLLCLAYALLWEEPELNEGDDLCQRLSVNALGQRWTHTHTHTHDRTALSVFFCCKRFTLRTEFLWECVIDFVFPRRQCCHRDNTYVHVQVLNLMLYRVAASLHCFKSVPPLI